MGCAAPVSEWTLPHDLTSDKAYSPSASPHFLLFQIPSKFCLPSEQFRCHPLHESFSESQPWDSFPLLPCTPCSLFHGVSTLPFLIDILCIYFSQRLSFLDSRDLVIPVVPSSHVTHSRHLMHVFEGVIKTKRNG